MHFISHSLDISARPFYLIQERINVFFLFFAENCWFFSKSNFDRKRVATNAYGPKSCQKVFYRHMCITGRNSASPSLSLSPLISDWLWSFNFRDENLIICLTPRPASSWNHHSHIAIVVRPPWLKSFANQKTGQVICKGFFRMTTLWFDKFFEIWKKSHVILQRVFQYDHFVISRDLLFI